MKKFFQITGVVITSLFAFPAIAGQFDGTWRGAYKCGQGNTGVLISINGNYGSFEFYPISGGANWAKSGSFYININSSGNNVTATPSRWINKPEGYRMVGFSGEIQSNTLIGSVNFHNCSTIRATRESYNTAILPAQPQKESKGFCSENPLICALGVFAVIGALSGSNSDEDSGYDHETRQCPTATKRKESLWGGVQCCRSAGDCFSP